MQGGQGQQRSIMDDRPEQKATGCPTDAPPICHTELVICRSLASAVPAAPVRFLEFSGLSAGEPLALWNGVEGRRVEDPRTAAKTTMNCAVRDRKEVGLG
jgi:hypothetical protein